MRVLAAVAVIFGLGFSLILYCAIIVGSRADAEMGIDDGENYLEIPQDKSENENAMREGRLWDSQES
ncbi:MAG: hypothetical protein LUI87_16785 [Lachnospiraceae bacterium]|nr:hypothetical protein [Lachnospiraceae bacterium]